MESLAASAIEGRQGWQSFVALVHPRAVELARFQPIGRLRDRPDELHEIALRVVAKLHRDNHHVLRAYFAKPDRPSFRAWMKRVVASTALDHLRQHPEFRRSGATSDRWIDLVSLASQCDTDPNASIEQKRDQVLRDLQAILDAVTRGSDDSLPMLAARWHVSAASLKRLRNRSDHAIAILRATLAGLSQREVAASLGLSRRDVELTLGYVEELLRARYAQSRAS
jgi:DNA-directed RNA polymerase specialized sigma24 family protein